MCAAAAAAAINPLSFRGVNPINSGLDGASGKAPRVARCILSASTQSDADHVGMELRMIHNKVFWVPKEAPSYVKKIKDWFLTYLFNHSATPPVAATKAETEKFFAQMKDELGFDPRNTRETCAAIKAAVDGTKPISELTETTNARGDQVFTIPSRGIVVICKGHTGEYLDHNNVDIFFACHRSDGSPMTESREMERFATDFSEHRKKFNKQEPKPNHFAFCCHNTDTPVIYTWVNYTHIEQWPPFRIGTMFHNSSGKKLEGLSDEDVRAMAIRHNHKKMDNKGGKHVNKAHGASGSSGSAGAGALPVITTRKDSNDRGTVYSPPPDGNCALTAALIARDKAAGIDVTSESYRRELPAKAHTLRLQASGYLRAHAENWNANDANLTLTQKRLLKDLADKKATEQGRFESENRTFLSEGIASSDSRIISNTAKIAALTDEMRAIGIMTEGASYSGRLPATADANRRGTMIREATELAAKSADDHEWGGHAMLEAIGHTLGYNIVSRSGSELPGGTFNVVMSNPDNFLLSSGARGTLNLAHYGSHHYALGFDPALLASASA